MFHSGYLRIGPSHRRAPYTRDARISSHVHPYIKKAEKQQRLGLQGCVSLTAQSATTGPELAACHKIAGSGMAAAKCRPPCGHTAGLGVSGAAGQRAQIAPVCRKEGNVTVRRLLVAKVTRQRLQEITNLWH
eukprot:scaffold167679_cov31-Prasinocladus_malaysianus.AAC.2